MRVIFIVLGVVLVLVWLGVELRSRLPNLALACFGLAVVFGMLLIGAFFGIGLR